MKRVTVYDVARELGISASTVSRVLNNSILIGEEKRALILETAQRMGYEKRSIRRHKNRAILNIKLFLPTHKYVSTHLFYNAADLIKGLYEGFEDVRVNIITNLVGYDTDLFKTKKLGDIDGCVFAFSEPDEEVYQSIEERGIPIVELNRISSSRNYISCDNTAGMQRLMEEIRAKRSAPIRPFYFGFSQIPPIQEQRLRGFLEALSDLPGQELSVSNIAALDSSGIKHGVTETSGSPRKRRKQNTKGQAPYCTLSTLDEITPDLIRWLKAEGYNSILCFNDVVAVYFYQCALSQGYRIPEDFSLTGFDNSPVLDLLNRRIDTINLSVFQLAKEAGIWLQNTIMHREGGNIQRLIEGEYIPGETIGRRRYR